MRPCTQSVIAAESSPLDRSTTASGAAPSDQADVHRSIQARAFSGDTRAQSLALDAIDRGLGAVLPLVGQVFLAMPLMHAENMELQQRCVGFFETLSIGAPQEHAQSVQDHLDAAREHRDIIARFGRFPHRNAVLGRPDTAPEQDYLVKGRRFGQ